MYKRQAVGDSGKFSVAKVDSIIDVAVSDIKVGEDAEMCIRDSNQGGAVYEGGKTGKATLDIKNSTFTNNSAKKEGSAIYSGYTDRKSTRLNSSHRL